jgi:phosphopantetheinyl transferase
VDDILGSREHVAIALDRSTRPGIIQLLHALGMLSAHGVPLRLDCLHDRWGSRIVDLDGAVPATAGRSAIVPIPIFLPQLKADGIAPGPRRPEDEMRPASVKSSDAAAAPPGESPRDAVMRAYLKTMQGFLEAQSEVMGSLLRTTDSGDRTPALPNPSPDPFPDPSPTPSPATSHASSPPSAEGLPGFPLLGRIVERVPGESLVAVRTYDVDEDLYLNDHSLGTTVSMTDPSLRALPVMPLLMSLEIVAEAGAALFPDKKVVAIVDISANQWILFEEGKVTLRIDARRVTGQGDSIHVRVTIKEENDLDPRAKYRPGMAEATAVLADDYPPAPRSKAGPLSQPTECDWSGEAIYPKRTFHGPLFQGIRTIDRLADDGLDGRIEILPRSRLFRSDPDPNMMFDPVLVDSMGQAVWIWASREPFSGRAYLPYRAGALRLYGPKLPPRTPLGFNLRVRARDEMGVSTDLESLDEGGNVKVIIEDLSDRDFYISPALHRLILGPVAGGFADVWDPPSSFPVPPDSRLSFGFISRFPTSVLEGGYGVWRKALAFLILNPPERQAWKAAKVPLRREIQWLLGRAAVKDVVRHHLLKYAGQRLAAADVRIDADSRNRPFVAGGWKTSLSLVPQVSIAHTESMIAAVCGDADIDFGLGIDTEQVRAPDHDFLDGAFVPEELALLPSPREDEGRAEWIFRLWCAKEAVGKALGSGVPADPRHLSVIAVDAGTGAVTLRLDGGSAPGTSGSGPHPLRAVTFRRNDHVFAVSVFTRNGSP